MNTFDDGKPKALPLPGTLVDPEPAERGGNDADAVASVKQAIAEVNARPPDPAVAGETADASERKRLITEIRMMRRARANVAVQSALTGAKWTAFGLGLWHGGRWLKNALGGK